MSNVVISTRAEPLSRLLGANDATAGTAIADPADTLTDPTGTAGTIDLAALGPDAANALRIHPFGVGGATNTFLMAVYGCDKVLAAGPGTAPAWHYFLLAGFTCTLGTKTGVAGSAVGANQNYCGTIALLVGNANVSTETLSPNTNNEAHVLVDCKGSQFVKVLFAMNGSATSANCVYRRV